MSFRVEKIKPDETERCNAPHPAAGRPRKRAYRFVHPHPLRECYVLREKAKFDVPVLIGDPPPRLANARKKYGDRILTKELEHAQYFGALFIPWHAGGDVDMTPDRWRAHIASLESVSTETSTDPDLLVRRDIARGRLWRIKQVSDALVTDARKAQLMSKRRSRSRTLWHADTQAEKTRRTGDCAGGADGTDDSLRKEIDDLQNGAP